MGAAVGAMTMPGFFSSSKEKEIVFEYVPSDIKNFELEKLSNSLINIKEYFPNFDFDFSKIDKNVNSLSSKKLSETAIASFLSQKGNLFKNKFPSFNSDLLFYSIDNKGEKVSKTMEESIEYLRRLIKIEIVRRQNNINHSSEKVDISDLEFFIQHNFITHCIHLLENSLSSIKTELMHFYNGFKPKQQERDIYGKFKKTNELKIPIEHLNYLRETISGVLNYSRRKTENFEANMKFTFFGDEFFPKPQKEIEPKMIKRPYIKKEVKAESITDKVKGLFNNIFK
ncbi:MAG: hypothetical protein PHZ26_00375 [Candidatus Gracilibacteria bacterium]|nr:hypothetical protein [Candidatus Gracilibacteria bacterium]MDD2908192.1 hypothetical protein [Candidatus Gracilibacteria bacterium]